MLNCEANAKASIYKKTTTHLAITNIINDTRALLKMPNHAFETTVQMERSSSSVNVQHYKLTMLANLLLADIP